MTAKLAVDMVVGECAVYASTQVAEQGRTDCVHAGTISLVTAESGVMDRQPWSDKRCRVGSSFRRCTTHDKNLIVEQSFGNGENMCQCGMQE
jgi:hypothetical protein